jgi:hypothetical protein
MTLYSYVSRKEVCCDDDSGQVRTISRFIAPSPYTDQGQMALAKKLYPLAPESNLDDMQLIQHY